MPLEGSLKDTATDTLLNDMGSVPQRLDDGLALECLDSERSGLGRHDDKGHNRHLASGRLEPVIESCQGLDEHVDTFIPVLVSASSEDVERVVGLKVVVTVEMTSNEVVDLLLGLLMKVLELVNGRKLGDVEAVGQNTVRLSLQQMLRLESGDVRYGGEDIAGMGSSSLDAVPMVDTTLASLSINVEPLQVVVEVHRTGAEISAKESGMGSEDGRDIDMALLAEWQGDASKPFVEVRNDGLCLFVANKL